MQSDDMERARCRWEHWRRLLFIHRDEWKTLAMMPVNADGLATVHGVGHREGKVWIVKNAEKPISTGVKPAGWGLPTGGVKKGTRPIDAVLDEFEQETGIPKNKLTVIPTPVEVSVKSNGHMNICFLVDVDPDAEPNARIFDPAGNTTDVSLVDYRCDLEERDGKFYFHNELFYSTHRTLIVTAEFSGLASA